MKNIPLVSVLIPTYNVSLYIDEAIKSIINQTYKNLEIIIVDDCSTDGAYEKLLNLKSSDDRIKVFRNETNLKIAKTLNYCLSKATGTYIARMDGDDVSIPDRIEKQVHYLQSNPEIDLVGLNVIVIDEDGNEVKKLNFCTSPSIIKKLIRYHSPVPHFWLAKSSTYQQVGNYRLATVEDYDFLLRMDTLNLNFCNHPEFLYKQRIRKGNTATSSGLLQRKYIDYILELHSERQVNKQFYDSFNENNILFSHKIRSFEKLSFGLSNKLLYRFSLNVNKNKLLALFFLTSSVLLSPKYQGIYFLKKYKYNVILKRSLKITL